MSRDINATLDRLTELENEAARTPRNQDDQFDNLHDNEQFRDALCRAWPQIKAHIYDSEKQHIAELLRRQTPSIGNIGNPIDAKEVAKICIEFRKVDPEPAAFFCWPARWFPAIAAEIERKDWRIDFLEKALVEMERKLEAANNAYHAMYEAYQSETGG